MEETNSFLGQGWSFPPSFDTCSRSVEMVSGEQDIHESLVILLSTTPGERTMTVDYGCDLSPLAFQRLDLNLETFMINKIKKAIIDHEPRIQVNKIEIASSDELAGTINIYVSYTIKATNTEKNMVYPYYVEQVAVD